MMAKQKTYIAIDLKSFYASVECKERNRDPLTTNLVVADKSRTEKTICLAVSPSLMSCQNATEMELRSTISMKMQSWHIYGCAIQTNIISINSVK